jgi:hypothetical protein
MTVQRVTRTNLILTMLLSSVFCSLLPVDATAEKMDKRDFIFAIKCEEARPSRLYLVGKFKPRTRVTLLQSGTPRTCSAKATSHVEEMESSGAYLTRLDGSCEVPDQFQVGVFKKPVKDYERLALKEIIDPDEVLAIHRSIRNSKALLTDIWKAQGTNSVELGQMEEMTLKVYQVSLPHFIFLIASYDDGPEKSPISGPRFVLIKDEIYPLTGWCSYRTMNVFRLNGEHYIQSGSCCCDCGITIMELFRITQNGLDKTVSDWSLSD